VSQREAFNVNEKEAPVPAVEALLPTTQPRVGVPEALPVVVHVPAAPRSQVGSVDACRLYQANGNEGLSPAQPQGLVAQPLLDGHEPICPYSLFHLTEVGLGGNPVTVATDLPQVGVSPQALRQISYIEYLLQLA